jgi:hypothetical protein
VATVAISREENMLGKKKFESRAGQGKRRMPGMVVKEKATAQRRKAPAHPRVALDSHDGSFDMWSRL